MSGRTPSPGCPVPQISYLGTRSTKEFGNSRVIGNYSVLYTHQIIIKKKRKEKEEEEEEERRKKEEEGT